MPAIPAICNKCGTIFPGVALRGTGLKARFVDCKAGPCPKCGGTGRIPDGQYDIFGDTLFAILQNITDTDVIKQSIEVIKTNIAAKASPEKITEEARKAAPELKTLWDFIPKTRVEAYAFITLLILVLSKFIDFSPSLKAPSADTTVIQQQIINQSFQQYYSQNAPYKSVIQRDSHNKKKKKQLRKMKKQSQRKSRRK
jgi:hypothetical protein